jgi:hypothetical protein
VDAVLCDGALWVSLETSKKIARVTRVDPPSGGGTRGGGTGGGGTGGGTGGGADIRAPVIGSPRVTPKRVIKGTKTRLTYTLSEPAAISVRIERVLSGRLRKGSCVKPTSKLKKARKCKRYVRVRTAVRQADRGNNFITSGGGKLPTLYRFSITARDAARNVSIERHAKLRVLRKPRS